MASKKKKTHFEEIFEQTDVADCIKSGIQALGKYSSLIETSKQSDLESSVDIDSCLVSAHPLESRWDYAFGYRKQIFYVEVHHVCDSEVNVVIKKMKWLKTWQNQQQHPESLKTGAKYYWISSGRGVITKGSRYTHMLAQAGLDYPIKRLNLK